MKFRRQPKAKASGMNVLTAVTHERRRYRNHRHQQT